MNIVLSNKIPIGSNTHLLIGINRSVCGKEIDWEQEYGTVLTSQVKCNDCKETEPFKQRDKIKNAIVYLGE